MSVAKLGELVKKRGSYKAKMTQFMTVLKLMPDSGHSLTPSQVLELEMRASRLEVLYSEFDALQTELELLSEDVDERYGEREQFETQYYAQLSRARELLAAAPAPAAPAPSLDGARSSGSGCKHDFVRLPKIDLPHFDGDYQHWLQFRDTYISLIHNNSSISNINKFHYLRAALKGSASIIVQSLDLTEANYDIAWQLLSERYDNTRLLVNNHVQALFNVEPIQRESSQALRNVIDVTNKNLRALSSLGEPVDNWDTLIIFIMTKKLDPSTNRQWEEFKNSINSSPSLKQFTSFLSNRADLIETLNDNSKFVNKNKSSSSSSATTISSHQDSNKQIKNFHSTTKHKPFQHKNKCPMCSDAHFLFTCESFRKLDIEARIKKASESNVCMNCLRPGHSAKSCTLSHCKYCKYRHNTLLHREIFQENDNGDNVALSTNIISSPTSACNRGIVLLSTAMARVADVDGNLHSARLLLDNGSTSNFITQDLCGKLGLVRRSTSSTVSACHFLSIEESDQLTRFWELDSVPAGKCFSNEEQAFEELFQKTTRRDDNGQFVVTIPLKDSPESLGDSYTMAQRRFYALERKLERDSLLKDRYLKFMHEYIALDHMSENTLHHSSDKKYYMPHHGVVRESSTTTKLRVVYDCSARTSSGKSFNDIQMVGPTVQDDLLSILLRFRQHKFVVTGDVEKMYRAVLVEPHQRSLQQILFRFDRSEPLKSYTLKTLTYGTAAAAYLATKCLTSLADQSTEPAVRDSIKHDFYVDDFLSGGDTVDSVVELCNGVVQTHGSAKFNLRKWQSNSKSILESISNFDKHNIEKTLNLNDASPSKTLGLYWDSNLDNLFFTIELTVPNKITKRTILSIVSQVFDPMGLVGPCVVLAKMLLQHLWIQKCDWDSSVPTDIKLKFNDFIQSLPALNSIRIPRWVLCDSSVLIEYHTFTDASEKAYGACVYVRAVAVDGSVSVRLLASKNKVSPIKASTIPRLELCGALLGTRLYLKVRQSLTLPLSHCYFWCDSTIVLGWLSASPSRLNSFVRNRVSEIQEATINQTWSYVPSKSNPADLNSRGMKADSIGSSTLWWSGPDFLKHKEIDFPPSPLLQNLVLPEVVMHADVADETNDCSSNNLISALIHKSSSITKLIRVIAYVLRFIQNCKSNPKSSGSLTSSDLQSAKTLIIRSAQQEMFPDEYKILKNNQSLHKKNKLISLSPFIDSQDIIRVGGRLDNSHYTYDVKHPILLGSNHHLTKIIFKAMHKALFHAGPQILLANIRLSYWPLIVKNLSKKIVRQCVRCVRFKSQPIQIKMGNLPTDRTHLEFPFLNVGVDYAGPVLIADRKGRGCRLHKSYICVFVCFAVRAVHLELVSDLTKEGFLAAFSRFTARRGKSQRVYCDNGTNFVGAFNELTRLLESSSKDIEADIANHGIDFKFIPAYSPHFGGLWESAVKSTKHLLRRVLNLTHLTYEELSTCLIQIEAILNSRPLTPLSSDPSDLSYLSPAHFLIGRPLTSVPGPQVADVNLQQLERHERIEKLRHHFWQRYANEYISLLQQRTKWQTDGQDLKTGTMVLVKDMNQPPLLWLLGRVTDVKPGPDGRSRVAEILTKKGTITRAYNNLCPLPVSTS
ncbi:unnamed protein product [Plutella xylostella]|uniref:(diamondback moth) hypothetical protein n=1 Tax=Plutella xylostella TaxID=51655 RepID=A0A8S4D317_PLUXY|nr:unnamed protein product [Plutella xylostella]